MRVDMVEMVDEVGIMVVVTGIMVLMEIMEEVVVDGQLLVDLLNIGVAVAVV